MRARRTSPSPLLALSLAVAWIGWPAGAAEGGPDAAPPADAPEAEPDEIEVAYGMLRPVNTLGWTFTGLGLTGLGIGYAAALDGIDVGPVPAVGRILFMSSLFVTTIAGSVALRMLPYDYRGRPARTVAAVTFAVGMAAMVADSILRLVFAATHEPMPLPLTVSLQAVGLGSLTASSLTTLIDNEVLMRQLLGVLEARDTASAALRARPVLLPTPLPGGAGATIAGFF